MIKENEFFERRGIEFAIRAKFQRDFRFSVRLARSVDAELIGFALGHASDRVDNRRHQKSERHEDQHQQGKSCRIADAANFPAFAPSSERPTKKETGNYETK